ncbi:hypothetical protein [Endozoicomonas sp. ALD068]|uniref:hypothetical protein n=1 Tax=Endozoicomonas sp. ALD068 TaxID=3403080 RepID=UPI003BB53881
MTPVIAGFILVIPAKAGIHTDSPPEPYCPVSPWPCHPREGRDPPLALDSRLRGNDGNEIGNDGNEIGNDGNEIGNDGNEIGNDENEVGNDGGEGGNQSFATASERGNGMAAS